MNKIEIFPQTQALIFDLDGTLANTMPTHFIAWKETAQKYGIDFPEELFYKWAGIPTKKIIMMLNEMHGSNMDPIEVDHEKEQAFLQHIKTIKPIQPVFDIAKKYHQKMPMSIGTGGIPEVVALTLDVIGAKDMFDIIVSARDVKKHKPEPDTFLLCAEKMGVSPQFCQVFEDADMGVLAAKAAGMMVTDIRHFI